MDSWAVCCVLYHIISFLPHFNFSYPSHTPLSLSVCVYVRISYLCSLLVDVCPFLFLWKCLKILKRHGMCGVITGNGCELGGEGGFETN